MRNVSRKYSETMQNRRDFYASAEITFADGTKKPLGKSDFSISGNCVIDSAESGSFPLGILVSKRISISLMNDEDQWSEYDFYGAKIFLQTKFDLDDGTTETLNIGTFTVITPESYGTTISITAMDDSYKTDKPYNTSLSYPLSLGEALRDSCSTCGLVLLSSSVPNGDYIIPQIPTDITHRQFIGMCAMVSGGNAAFDEYNRLKIIPYDFTNFERFDGWDGGTFSPWTEGDKLDGGTFLPWTTGAAADGGSFGDREDIHILYQFVDGIKIDVDDVVITGLQIEGKDEADNTVTHLYGETGYVLSLENQLAAGKEDEFLEMIGKKIVGLRFRPFSGNHPAIPTVEFMDLALLVDWKQNIYQTVITDVSFQYFGFTNLKCSADSPIRNSSQYYSNQTKAIVEARKIVEREKTERELAVEMLNKALAESSGLYSTEEVQPDNSTIYYLHDKPTIKESKAVLKLTAEAIGFSMDGGKSYPYGFTLDGMLVMRIIQTEGLNADWITSGAFSVKDKDGKVIFSADINSKTVFISGDCVQIGDRTATEAISDLQKLVEDSDDNLLMDPLGLSSTYWEISGSVTRNQADPEGGTNAIRITPNGSDCYCSARKTNNKPIKTAGRSYMFSVWLKASKASEITLSLNHVNGIMQTVSVGTSWKRYTLSLRVESVTAENHVTIGGWGSFNTSDGDLYIYDPVVTYTLSWEEVLNLLTDNGAKKGIYALNGELYFSFNFARGGGLILGGENNGNGYEEVLTSNGVRVVRLDNTGISAIAGEIGGFTLDEKKIYGTSNSGKTIVMQKGSTDNQIAFAAGGTSHDSYSDCPFYVRMDGRVYSKDGSFDSATLNDVAVKNGYISIAYKKSNHTGSLNINSDGLNIDSGENTGGSVYIGKGQIEQGGSSSVPAGGLPNAGGYVQTFAQGSNEKTAYFDGENMRATGTKNRIVRTKDYGSVLQYCYEMASPMFGDIGEGITDEKGECCIYLDDVFFETVSAQMEYQVFLQKEGKGDIWVEEKTAQYFVVKGTENLKFAWEVKAVQKDYEYERLEFHAKMNYGTEMPGFPYEEDYLQEIKGLIEEREEVLYETA